MASDKIVNKILESANQEAQEIINKANKDAEEQKKAIQNDTAKRLEGLQKQFETDCKNLEQREKLNASIEERKRLLGTKRSVMDEAFDLARKDLKHLDQKDWQAFITKIVLSAVDTDTEYLKVPESDFKKYENKEQGVSFFQKLNDLLRDQGHDRPLKMDRDPAHFEDGLMLIGKYSDVNASFDVILENMREELEWDVTEILFGSGE